ncbi:unnamed protein product [Cunninghamella blakesleeana]
MTDYNMEEQYQFTNESIQMMQQRELNDFAEYDQAMYGNNNDYPLYYYHNNDAAVDYSYGMEEEVQEMDDDMMMWENDDDQEDQDDQEEEEENHDDEALLRLIVGVQMYISESTTLSKKDSPLLDLQYKMYTYMKQKAIELGVDTSNLY